MNLFPDSADFVPVFREKGIPIVLLVDLSHFQPVADRIEEPVNLCSTDNEKLLLVFQLFEYFVKAPAYFHISIAPGTAQYDVPAIWQRLFPQFFEYTPPHHYGMSGSSFLKMVHILRYAPRQGPIPANDQVGVVSNYHTDDLAVHDSDGYFESYAWMRIVINKLEIIERQLINIVACDLKTWKRTGFP